MWAPFKSGIIMSLAVFALLLADCTPITITITWHNSHTKVQAQTKIPLAEDAFGNSVGTHALTINPADFKVDLAGTDYAIDNGGIAFITLLSSQGSPIASRDFEWVRVGTDAILADPSSATAWASNYPNAKNVRFSFSPGPEPADGQPHTLSVHVYYNGTPEGSKTVTLPPVAPPAGPPCNHISLGGECG